MRVLPLPAFMAVWLAFVALLGAVAGTGMDLHLFPDDIDRRDIFVFHATAKVVWEKEISPYTPAGQDEISAELGFPTWPFLHPPASLPYFLPFGLLNQDTALWVSLGVNIAAAALALTLMVGWCRPWFGALRWPLTLTFVFALAPSTFQTLWLGQVNFVVLLGIMLVLAFPRTKLAGVGLFMAVLLKIYPLLLLPGLLRDRQYKTAITGLLLLGAAFVASLILFPPVWQLEWGDQSLALTRDIASTGPLEDYLRRGNLSWSGLVTRHLQFSPDYLYLADLSPPVKSAITLLGTLVLMGLTYRPLWRAPAASWEQNAMTTLVLTSLIAPIVWGHHSVFIFPVMLWLLAATTQQRDWPRFLLTVTAICMILYRTMASDFNDPLWFFASLPFAGHLLLWVLTRQVPPPASLDPR